MSICPRCGDLVTIRYVNGNRVPIHESGRCGGPLPVNDYSGRRQITEDLCYGRQCPECGDYVFFIRHNGGCCWIDPPLGPPWYKHFCFDDISTKGGGRTSLLDSYKLNEFSEKQKLCIVSYTDVSWPNKATKVVIAIGDKSKYELIVAGNAGFLIGKLCIYDVEKFVMYPVEISHYKYIVVAQINEGDNPEQEFVCPECKEMVYFDNLKQHIDMHYCNSIINR